MLVKKIEPPTSENSKSGRIWGNSENSPRFIDRPQKEFFSKKHLFYIQGPDPLSWSSVGLDLGQALAFMMALQCMSSAILPMHLALSFRS